MGVSMCGGQMLMSGVFTFHCLPQFQEMGSFNELGDLWQAAAPGSKFVHFPITRPMVTEMTGHVCLLLVCQRSQYFVWEVVYWLSYHTPPPQDLVSVARSSKQARDTELESSTWLSWRGINGRHWDWMQLHDEDCGFDTGTKARETTCLAILQRGKTGSGSAYL